MDRMERMARTWTSRLPARYFAVTVVAAPGYWVVCISEMQAVERQSAQVGSRTVARFAVCLNRLDAVE